MDRIEFVNSIRYTEDTDAVKTLITFFEQYMALYNLVEDIVSVSCEGVDGNTIQFRIDYTSKDTALKNFNLINLNNSIVIYESCCILRCEFTDRNDQLIVYMSRM